MRKRIWILAAAAALTCTAPAYAGGLYSGNHYKSKMVDGSARMRAATYGSGYAQSRRIDGSARMRAATHGIETYRAARIDGDAAMRRARMAGPFDARAYSAASRDRGHFRPEGK